jgi:hypothetical protein
MTFQYLAATLTATDSDLGLTIRRDPVFNDGASTLLRLGASPSGRTWTFPIEFEMERITYVAGDGVSRTHQSDVACRLSRRRLAPIAHELAALKMAKGKAVAPEDISELIRLGVFEFLTRGGSKQKFVPNYSVSWID